MMSTLVDYVVGLELEKSEQKKRRKRIVTVSLVFNLGLLAYLKYFNFFLESFQSAFSFWGGSIGGSTLNIILPVGISFYTFQTLSYSLYVYHGRIKPTRDLLSFAAFVCFFPQLVAGPIERAGHLLKQIQRPKTLSLLNFQFGSIRILWGLFKKVVIADRLGIIVDYVYNSGSTFSGAEYLIATVLFGLQIYCDFSGYSDITIGVARLFDIRLMENFRTPYFTRSITEFWHRWHVSLST